MRNEEVIILITKPTAVNEESCLMMQMIRELSVTLFVCLFVSKRTVFKGPWESFTPGLVLGVLCTPSLGPPAAL